MLFVAIVIYNKKAQDITSWRELLSFKESLGSDQLRLIVVDNSDKNIFSDKEDAAFEGIKYIRNNKNLGLSKAYNRALRYAKKESADPKKDFMLFLDDDTAVSKDYLKRIYNETFEAADSSDGVNVITSMVSSDGRPLSPTKGFRFRYKKNDYITKPGIYKDITFINSTMAIRLESLLKAGGFNEKLFLDMIDYTLCYSLSGKGLCKVKVLDEVIEQSFSGRTKVSKKILLKRFDIYKKDFETFCRITGRSRIFCRLALLKRRLMIELKSGR